MNSSSNQNKLLFSAIGLIGVAIVIFVLTFTVFSNKSQLNVPIIDKELDPDLAQLFNSAEYFSTIDESDENFALTQKDVATFARATGDAFRDNKDPVAFTFNKGYLQEGDAYIFTGTYYNLAGTIKLTLTKYDKGIIKVSITNEKDNTNIDNSLNLNGVKNNLLTQLPINTNLYSIRYLYSTDKIIVAFYQGFSKTDVDEAVSILQTAYGNAYSPEDFQFNINAVGTFTLDNIYRYLVDPNSVL